MPDWKAAYVPRGKLTGHLLSETHTVGSWKAELFRTTGFTLEEADLLEEQLPEIATRYPATEWHLSISNQEGNPHQMTVYQRQVEAGDTVALGRNSTDGDGDAPMYLVLIGSRTPVAFDRGDDPRGGFAIHEVFPSPTSGVATISFSLPKNSDVSVTVYDALGREVARPVYGRFGVGAHSVAWNGEGLAGGIYFVRMNAGGFATVRTLVRLE